MERGRGSYQLAGFTCERIEDQAFGDDEYYYIRVDGKDLWNSMSGFPYPSIILDEMLERKMIDQDTFDKALKGMDAKDIVPKAVGKTDVI